MRGAEDEGARNELRDVATDRLVSAVGAAGRDPELIVCVARVVRQAFVKEEPQQHEERTQNVLAPVERERRRAAPPEPPQADDGDRVDRNHLEQVQQSDRSELPSGGGGGFHGGRV